MEDSVSSVNVETLSLPVEPLLQADTVDLAQSMEPRIDDLSIKCVSILTNPNCLENQQTLVAR